MSNFQFWVALKNDDFLNLCFLVDLMPSSFRTETVNRSVCQAIGFAGWLGPAVCGHTNDACYFLGGSVHKAPVTCIDVSQDNALVASGSEEGTANLIHANSGKVSKPAFRHYDFNNEHYFQIITTFICAKKDARDQRPPQNGDNDEQSETEDQDAISVEAIAFSKVSPALFTGTVNGEIAIWDLNTHVVRQSFPTQVRSFVYFRHFIHFNPDNPRNPGGKA